MFVVVWSSGLVSVLRRTVVGCDPGESLFVVGWSPALVVTGVSKTSEEVMLGRVRSDDGLTLETLATNQIPQAKNIPYQPLLIKPIFYLLANEEKRFFFQN